MQYTMDSDLIHLLSTGFEQDALLGIAMMEGKPERYSAEIFSALLAKWTPHLSSYCKSVFPFFADPYRSVESDDKTSFGTGNGQLQRERTFLDGVEVLLENLNKNGSDPGSFLRMLSGQRALSAEYLRIIRKIWGEQYAAVFINMVEEETRRPPRQIGYAPTFLCNLSCEYCMSVDKPSISADISVAKKVMSWAAENGVVRMRLYGGEPTFYPHLPGLIDEAQRYGFKIYFASNMLTDKSNYQMMSSESIDSIMIHVASYPPTGGVYRRFINNIKTVRDAGINLVLRYNLQDEDWDFLVDMMGQFEIKEIAFAPIVSHDASLNGRREYWVDQAKLSWRFADYMISRGVRPILARPLPLCCIEEINRDAGGDSRWDIFTGSCSLALNDYMFNMLVWPDGRVLLCDGDSRPEGGFLWDYSGWEDLQRFIAPRILQWQESSLFGECGDCYYKARALCQGSCLAAKSNRS